MDDQGLVFDMAAIQGETTARYWLTVRCAEHVRHDQARGGLHIRRLHAFRPGDGLVCYSPSRTTGVKDGLRSFTALGFVADRAVETGLWDVEWLAAVDQPIHPMLDWLDFAQVPGWGYRLCLGAIEIPEVDFDFLRHVMTQSHVMTRNSII